MMDHLKQESLIINGKKLQSCNQLLFFFHLLFVLLVGAMCTYSWRELNRFQCV